MFIASLNRLIAKLGTTGSADKRNGMVLVCLAHLEVRKMVMLLKHTVLSHEDRPGSHITIPRISRETDISRQK